MNIQRNYTSSAVNITYTARQSSVKNTDGSTASETLMSVEVPDTWSQTATDILAQKYFRRAGVPSNTAPVEEEGVPRWLQRHKPVEGATFGGETSARQVFHRLTGCWTYWGWKGGYFDTEKDAQAFYDEVFHMLAAQMCAPNSPQWFNTGLHWAYGIEGEAKGYFWVDQDGAARESTTDYEHPQASACFITEMQDNLTGENGILDNIRTEGRIFKLGSGAGSNFSKIRGENEPLSGGGKSSGLMSFLRVGDRSAGSIKSGGTCLAPYTLVYTAQGVVAVEELAKRAEDFVVLSFDPPANRYKAKTARAWLSGHKEVLRIQTDKGSFDLSYDHPVRLSDGRMVKTGELKVGQSLFSCSVSDQNGYLCVNLKDGKKGKKLLHRLVAKDVMRATLKFKGLPNKIVHHKDGNRLNNAPSNLQIMTQSQHARHHSAEAVATNTHVFQLQRFPKTGATNGMHSSNEFWQDIDRSEAYRKKQSDILTNSGRASAMQSESVKSKMMNTGYALINAGYDISTFDSYVAARKSILSKSTSSNDLHKQFEQHFGSYTAFVTELSNNNHRVISVESVGVMDVYDVEVDCPTVDDKTPQSGHNFVIWHNNETSPTGSGIVVSNTRRAAKMVILDVDHPDIEKFVDWKVIEEQKVAALVTGSKLNRKHLNAIIKATSEEESGVEGDARFDRKQNPTLSRAIRAARKVSISDNYIQRVIQFAEQGYTSIDFPEYDVDWNSEAYATVSGQNSNNSVRVSNQFMDAVKNNGTFDLFWRTELDKAKKEGREPSAHTTLQAKDLWRKISEAAWHSADPAVMFSDTINEWHTCPEDGEIVATNPCAEYVFLNNTACNLASINLTKFYNVASHKYDLEGLSHVARMWTIVLDITVGMAQYPTEEIAKRSHRFRTLGLGFANLGALLMRLGLPYDSDGGRVVASQLVALIHLSAYKTSADIAEHLGAFPAFGRNSIHVENVIEKHQHYLQLCESRYTQVISEFNVCFLKDLVESTKKAVKLGSGVRNAQVTVCAPTGTISLLMDCDTSGIEPDFALVKFKKLAGGGYFKIVNQSVPFALRRLGYSAKQIDAIINYAVGAGSLQGCPVINRTSLAAKGFTTEALDKVEAGLKSAFEMQFAFNKWSLGETFCKEVLGFTEAQLNDYSFNMLRELGFSSEEIGQANNYVCGSMTLEGAPHLKEEDYDVFDCANKCGKYGQRFISTDGHLNMMAAVQPFLSGAISKTVNLPNSATVEDIANVYLKAYDLKLKCVALYRDGSKLSQPLNTSLDDDDVSDDLLNNIESAVSNLPMPESAQSIVEKFVVSYVAKQRRLPNRRNGYTQKAKIGGQSIFLRTGDYEDGTLGEVFIDMHKEGAGMRSLLNCFAIAVSLGLQYGVPLEEYVNQFTFTKFEPSGMVTGHDRIKMASSVIDYVFRELAISYLGRDDLAHVQLPIVEPLEWVSASDNTCEVTLPTTLPGLVGISTQRDHAKQKGYEGSSCPDCGSWTLVRNGTCLKCDTCGATTGCS